MSGLEKALNNRIKGVKKTVIGKVSDVLSAPARAYYGSKQKTAERDTKTLKTARSYGKAASFDNMGRPSDALKARTAADEVRMRRK